MARLHRGLLCLGVIVALAACTFDDAALADRICDANSDCALGICIDGICVSESEWSADATLDAGDTSVSDVVTGADAANDVLGDAVTDCEDTETACDGDRVVACVDGVDVVVADCVAEDACADALGFGCVCRDAACVARTCEAGDRRCAGAIVQVCDDAGSWTDDRVCEGGTVCETGACVAPTCSPGASLCVGEMLVVCDEDGEVAESRDCAAEDAWCDDAGVAPVCVPRTCVPGAMTCADEVGLDGDEALVCDDRGSGWVVAAECSPGATTCLDGACVPVVCVPGRSTCVGLEAVSTCDDRGLSSSEALCEGFCDASGDVARCVPSVCDTGSLRCLDATRVEQCAERGSGWSIAETCSEGLVCADGACVERSCAPGTSFCDSSGLLATCNDDGSGIASTEPCAFRCESGACVASTCGDGLVDPDRGETCDDANALLCDGCEDCQRRAVLTMSALAVSTGGPSWIPGASDLTMEAWVRSRSDGGLFGLGGLTERDHLSVSLESGFVVFQYRLDEGREVVVRGQTPVVGAGWTHVAVVRFAVTGAAIFVNGELDAWTYPERDRTSIDETVGRIWIGSEGGGATSDFDADEFRVSSSARYLTRFAPVRRHEVDGTTVALYHFDDVASSSFEDAVGPGRALTVVGGIMTADSCFGSPATSLECGDGVRARWEGCDGGAPCDERCLTERPCRDGVERSGSCYLLLTSADSWTNQLRACRAWTGGDLVAITSGGENDWVRDRFGGPHWMGLNDRGSGWGDEGSFGWTTGESAGFSRWADGEPNNGGWGGDEDCGEFRSTGRWNDLNCNDVRTAICERVAE